MQNKDESDKPFQAEYMDNLKNLVACVRSGRITLPTREQLEQLLGQCPS